MAMAMAMPSLLGLQVKGSIHRKTSIFHGSDDPRSKTSPLPTRNVTPWRALPPSRLQERILETVKSSTKRTIDAFVDSVFRFEDQPLLPSQMNFAPVEEIGEAVEVFCIEGEIPPDFPEGVFIRNGPNPLFGGWKSTKSIFGTSGHTWAEGEGMLHAVYFTKSSYGKNWTVTYKNKYVESETFKSEKLRRKPGFLPTGEGDHGAILAAFVLNTLRFNKINKQMSNSNVFEHSGKIYAISENDVAQEVDLHTLEVLGDWDFNGAWSRPFTSHPKKAPKTGELVTLGISVKKPHCVVGVISANGQKLLHKVDLGLQRSVFSHEIGVTDKYNVIIDHPLIFDFNRLKKGGSLLKYEPGEYARIGVMPRYGDAASVRWFNVETCCAFHIFNCYEDGDEVVVRGCRALESVFPGPEWGSNKFEWFSKGFNFMEQSDRNSNELTSEDGYLFTSAYEWRLNMETGEVNEGNLTPTDFSLGYPFVNGDFTGLKNQYGFAQVVHSKSSSDCGIAKYGGLAKLCFNEPCSRPFEDSKRLIKVEYHHFEENTYCTGSVFVPRTDGTPEQDEDSGWIVSFVHNEEKDISQVFIIDAKKFESEPVAKIALPQRVPYGFHGTFVKSKEIV